MFVDKSPTNELVDNTFTVLSKIFSSISSFTVLSKTSLIASVSLGFTKLVKDVVKKPNNTAIIDVIKNIIIVLVNILLNLFFSFILEMDDVIVKNIKGTIITKSRFKNTNCKRKNKKHKNSSEPTILHNNTNILSKC